MSNIVYIESNWKNKKQFKEKLNSCYALKSNDTLIFGANLESLIGLIFFSVEC